MGIEDFQTEICRKALIPNRTLQGFLKEGSEPCSLRPALRPQHFPQGRSAGAAVVNVTGFVLIQINQTGSEGDQLVRGDVSSGGGRFRIGSGPANGPKIPCYLRARFFLLVVRGRGTKTSKTVPLFGRMSVRR